MKSIIKAPSFPVAAARAITIAMTLALASLMFLLPATSNNLVVNARNLTCPNVQAVDNFEIEKFLGRWYEMYRDHWTPYPKSECNTIKWYIISYNGKIGLKKSQVAGLHYNQDKQKVYRYLIEA